MNARAEGSAESGARGGRNWLVGGAVGGVVGSLLFGGLLWMVDPDVVAVAIPSIYGIDPAGVVGWAIHLFHGLVLGVIFGFIVSREPILGTLMADVETGFLAAMGPGVRSGLAGLLYGMAVWAILPAIVLPLWASTVGLDEPGFPTAGTESLVGHLVFGLVLGAIAWFIARPAQETEETEAPFEEATDTTPDR